MDDPIQQAQAQTQQQPDSEEVLAATNQALLKKKRLANQQDTAPNQSAISQALATLDPKSKDVAVQIGKAIKTPNYAGLCLQWVDDQQGNKNRYPTAIADYQAHSQANDIQTSDKIPQGARIYFSPNDSNGGMGHVGLSNGNGTFTSATDNGIKTFAVKDWEKATGQQMLGWTKSS